jgi:hypothetical protein
MPSAAMAISAMSVLRNIDFPPRETAIELRKRCRWPKSYQTDLTRPRYKRITNERVSDKQVRVIGS